MRDCLRRNLADLGCLRLSRISWMATFERMLVRSQCLVFSFIASLVACGNETSSEDSSQDLGLADIDSGTPDGGGMEDAGTMEDMAARDAGSMVFELLEAAPAPTSMLSAGTPVTFRFEFSEDLAPSQTLIVVSQVRTAGNSEETQFLTPMGTILETDAVTPENGTTRVDIVFQGLEAASGRDLVPGGLLEDDLLTLSYSVVNLGGG